MNQKSNAAIGSLTITAEMANRLIADCVSKAEEMGKKMAIAICDPSGIQKAFLRMDGAPLLAVNTALDKAYTAVSFGISTGAWHEFIRNDAPLAAGIANLPRLIVFGGGYPILLDGELIGGIGVSGGHYTEDMACARHGLTTNGFQAD